MARQKQKIKIKSLKPFERLVFDVLKNARRPLSINEVSTFSGMSWVTAKKALNELKNKRKSIGSKKKGKSIIWFIKKRKPIRLELNFDKNEKNQYKKFDGSICFQVQLKLTTFPDKLSYFPVTFKKHRSKQTRLIDRNSLQYSSTTFDGKILICLQDKLDVFPSTMDFLFSLEDKWEQNEVCIDQVRRGLWNPFPVHNIDDERMNELIDNLVHVMEKKNKLVIPHQLLTLAVLNTIDERLSKTNTSKYFKTRHLSFLSMGRRAVASRRLKGNNYIEEYGHGWLRTDKEFDQVDFWANQNNGGKNI